jgi:HEPN domain-containing protein
MSNPIDEARRWVQYAHWDIVDVENNMQSEQVPHPIVCFHCQQAAEKMLKAVLVLNREPPPRTHDLTAILRRIEPLAGSVEDVMPTFDVFRSWRVGCRAQALRSPFPQTREAGGIS